MILYPSLKFFKEKKWVHYILLKYCEHNGFKCQMNYEHDTNQHLWEFSVHNGWITEDVDILREEYSVDYF